MGNSKIREKKGVMNQIVGVFILMLIISILAGMSFLFVGTLKTQIGDTTPRTSISVLNETLTTVTEKGEQVTNSSLLLFSMDTSSLFVINASSGIVIESANYTSTSDGIIRFTGVDTTTNNTDWNASFSYDYVAADDETAYLAVNKTEGAGYQTVSYLGILFLALIFGAILTVVLRVILPYINLGQGVGEF